MAIAAALAAVIVGLPAASCLRRWHAARLRRRLLALSPEQRNEVQLPLLPEAEVETKDVLRDLLRDLRAPGTDVAPSTLPEGGKNEVTEA